MRGHGGRPITALLVVGLMALVAPWAAADRPAAEFFAQRGEQASKDGKWEEAAGHYRRALEEDPTFLPARCGLGEALLAAGQRNPGVEELRRFVKEGSALAPLPASWSALLSRAKKRLADVDGLGAELEKIVDDNVAALLKVAERWKEKDRETAMRALGDVLVLRPGHATASDLLVELGAPAPGGKVIPVFDGTDMLEFSGMGSQWRVEDGLLVGNTEEHAVFERTHQSFEGEFDLALDVQVVRGFSEYPIFALCGAVKEARNAVAFGMWQDEIYLQEEMDKDETRHRFSKAMNRMKPAFDPTAWNRFELRFRKDRIQAFLNGREFRSMPRPVGREGGYLGLHVQHCLVKVRNVVAIQR